MSAAQAAQSTAPRNLDELGLQVQARFKDFLNRCGYCFELRPPDGALCSFTSVVEAEASQSQHTMRVGNIVLRIRRTHLAAALPPSLQDYHAQVASMRENDTTTMYVDMSHLLQYDGNLAVAVQDEYYRYALL